MDRVLAPDAPYRQWVLSLPWRLRYLVAYRRGLARKVLREFLRVLFAWQRRVARRCDEPPPIAPARALQEAFEFSA